MSEELAADVAKQPVILIAEDEEPIALALSFIVEDAGYYPLVAMDGKEALALARSRHPALIITDLMMPRMSGQELIACLRGEAAEDRHTPIILLTAADRTLAAESGADAVLAKPFEITEVEWVLRHFLG